MSLINNVDIYETIKLLNEGGFGSVYLAINAHTKEIVALKLLNPELLQREGFRERFHEEALILRQMPRHEHIVQLLDYGEAYQQPYLVMEYLPGHDLRDLIDQGPLRARRAAQIGCQVADALKAAAGRGLVHCDVKPENIRISEDSYTERLRVRLMDFGIARVLGADLRDIAGTVTYMAPELWRGEQPSPAADIYALGCVLYESLTGRPPVFLLNIDDHPSTRQALMRLHLYGLPDWSPFGQIKELEAFVALLKIMLHKEPVLRPSAEVVYQTLQSISTTLSEEFCLQPDWSSALARDPERTRTHLPGDFTSTLKPLPVAQAEPTAWVTGRPEPVAPVPEAVEKPEEAATIPETPPARTLQAHFMRSQASCELGEAVCRAGLLVDKLFFTGAQTGEILRHDLESTRRSRWKIPGLKVYSHNWAFLACPGAILFHTGGADYYLLDRDSGRLLKSGIFPEAGLRLVTRQPYLWLAGSKPALYRGNLADLAAFETYPLETRVMGLPCFWQDQLLAPTRQGVFLLNPETKISQRIGPIAPVRSVFTVTLDNQRHYGVVMYSGLNPQGIQHNILRLIALDGASFPTIAEVNITGQPVGGLQRSGNYFVLVCSDGQCWGWRLLSAQTPGFTPEWHADLGEGSLVRGEVLVKNGICLIPVGDARGEKLLVRNAATGDILTTPPLSGETFLAPFMEDRLAALLIGSGRLDVFRILIDT